MDTAALAPDAVRRGRCNATYEDSAWATLTLITPRLGVEILRQGVETVRLQGRDRSLPCSSRGFISIVSDWIGHASM